jgi:hypothetical protein
MARNDVFDDQDINKKQQIDDRPWGERFRLLALAYHCRHSYKGRQSQRLQQPAIVLCFIAVL